MKTTKTVPMTRYIMIIMAILATAALTLGAACGDGEPTTQPTATTPATQTPAPTPTTQTIATMVPTPTTQTTPTLVPAQTEEPRVQETRTTPNTTPGPGHIPTQEAPPATAEPTPATASQGRYIVPPYLSQQELNCFSEWHRSGESEISTEHDIVWDIIRAYPECFTDETLIRLIIIDDMSDSKGFPADQESCALNSEAGSLLRTGLEAQANDEKHSVGLLYAALMAAAQEAATCISAEAIEATWTQDLLDAGNCITGQGPEAMEFLRHAIDGTGEHRTLDQVAAGCQEKTARNDMECLTGTPTDRVLCLVGDSLDLEPARGASVDSTGGPPSPKRAGTRPPDPVLTTFQDYGANPFIDASEDNRSTFALDGDTASFQYALALMAQGYPPQEESVRPEEWINAVDQGYDDSLRKTDGLALSLDGTSAPYAGHAGTEQYLYRTLRVGVLSPEITGPRTTPVSLILVIDTSGSMEQRANEQGDTRLQMAKQLSRVLLGHLREGDRAGIVVYEETAYVVEPITRYEDLQALDHSVSSLNTRRDHPRRGRDKEGVPDGGARTAGRTSGQDRGSLGRRRQHRPDRPRRHTCPDRRAVPPGSRAPHHRYRALAQLQ